MNQGDVRNLYPAVKITTLTVRRELSWTRLSLKLPCPHLDLTELERLMYCIIQVDLTNVLCLSVGGAKNARTENARVENAAPCAVPN